MAVNSMNKAYDYAGHIGIPVENLQRSVAFYQRLGFEEVESYRLDNDDGTHNLVTFISLNGMLLELYQLANESVERRVGAINHVAIRVENLKVVKSLLQQLEIPLVDQPTTLPFGPRGMTYLMIEGPDNERVEFNQYHL